MVKQCDRMTVTFIRQRLQPYLIDAGAARGDGQLRMRQCACSRIRGV
jgi:hypothetical protein